MVSAHSHEPQAANVESLEHERVQLIRREDIPAIHSIEVEGQTHALGEHRDFRRHPALAAFLPEHSRAALSWTRLSEGEVLANHVHTVRSMILVCQGSGRVTGELESVLREGDAVLVGRGCAHGFVGGAPSGMSALSLQFEGRGLYEDTRAPLVAFAPEGSLSALLRYNEDRLENLSRSRFFQLVTDETLDMPACRERFLSCLHAWSRHFQTVMFARQASCEDPVYAAAFQDHLREEIGHDALLATHRKGLQPVWDPVIESAAAWFVSRMHILDNCAKTAVVHLVLESTGARFHRVAARARVLKGIDYFHVHDHHDDDHTQVGIDLLSGESPETYAHLRSVVGQAWDVFGVLLDRMAEQVDAARHPSGAPDASG